MKRIRRHQRTEGVNERILVLIAAEELRDHRQHYEEDLGFPAELIEARLAECEEALNVEKANHRFLSPPSTTITRTRRS